MRNSQSSREIRTARMRLLTAGNLLVFSGLCLGFRIEDLIGQNVFDNNVDYQHPLPDEFANERQDIQSPDILIPAFIATFIASSITNLLFPSVPLIPVAPPTSPPTSPPPPPPSPTLPPAGQGIYLIEYSLQISFPKLCITKKYFSL